GTARHGTARHGTARHGTARRRGTQRQTYDTPGGVSTAANEHASCHRSSAIYVIGHSILKKSTLIDIFCAASAFFSVISCSKAADGLVSLSPSPQNGSLSLTCRTGAVWIIRRGMP
ncbi:MAG TPA: hypothetical protein PLF25_02030, partial [Accumulibacter sp.]|nr:hypothetical protein [Accumulibacter sp.]